MAVSILAIKFNHDTNAATHDALNIRIDAGSTVNVPEWTGGETAASQSPAAYAIKAVGGNTITVQARFKTDQVVNFMEVRAVFVTKSGGSTKTPLGDLAPTQVIFNVDGLSGFVSFRCLSGLGTTVRAKNIQVEVAVPHHARRRVDRSRRDPPPHLRPPGRTDCAVAADAVTTR